MSVAEFGPPPLQFWSQIPDSEARYVTAHLRRFMNNSRSDVVTFVGPILSYFSTKLELPVLLLSTRSLPHPSVRVSLNTRTELQSNYLHFVLYLPTAPHFPLLLRGSKILVDTKAVSLASGLVNMVGRVENRLSMLTVLASEELWAGTKQ